MKFKHSAFTENTPEMREWLEELGWKSKYIQEGADIIVCASNTGLFSAIVEETQQWFKAYKAECIDCRSNPELFKAVTAIRDDSDYMQWFRNIFKGGHWFNDKHQRVGPVCYDKMSLKELIEKFKKEEK